MKNIEPWLTPQVCGVTVIVADKYFDQTSRLLSGAVYVWGEVDVTFNKGGPPH